MTFLCLPTPMHPIIQWNLQSYYTHFSDLKCLIKEHSPSVLCLQETCISPNRRTFPPSSYNLFTSNPTRNDLHERGTAVLVHRKLFNQEIELNTNLQATAVRVGLGKLYTVCSLYLPHLPVNTLKQDLNNLMDQLPEPFILLGDMNARSSMWGDTIANPNQRGTIIEQLLLERSVSYTHLTLPTNREV